MSMKLDEALHHLAEVHTGWDEKTGFYVRMGATPLFECSGAQYVEAWQQVRMHLSLNINPSPTPVSGD